VINEEKEKEQIAQMMNEISEIKKLQEESTK